MFAVIKTGGKQYRVTADDILKLEKVDGDAGDIVQFNDVLMVGEGENVTVGAPLVDGASVAAEVVDQGRGRKVIAFKKRRRQNSRRKRGHRQMITTVRISEILTGGAKPSKKAAAKKPAAEKAPAPAKEEAVAAYAPAPAPATSSAPLFTAPTGGEQDKLTKIKGIGPVAEKQLNEQGIMTYAQIAALTEDEIIKVDEYMPFSADQIKDWQGQAKELIKE
ncbi:MAG: 50S ribosomal protein L21 [Pseudomonadota bacterium]